MTDPKPIAAHWTHVADQWIDWAGRPGHELPVISTLRLSTPSPW